jgi:hypothetical protein
MSEKDEPRVEAERRYPKKPFVYESHVQKSFVAGAEWQASRKVEVNNVLSGWVGWFEVNDSHVGGKQAFTAYEVAELLRGPEPFGFTATNHETGADDE